MEVEQPAHPSTSAVGLDAGISKLVTLSDGTVFEPVNSFKQNQSRLARLQRQLARKVKFSANWKKQKARISAYIRISPTSAAITYTKSQQQSAKTTR